MCTRRDSANLFRSETLERIQSASALARGSTDGCQDILGLHAVPKVSLDEASFDLTIAPDNEGSRNGQEPCAVSLKPLKVDAELPVHLLDRLADPERETERKAVGQVQIAQNRERQAVLLLQSLPIGREFRHDGNHVPSRGDDIRIGARQGARLSLCRLCGRAVSY